MLFWCIVLSVLVAPVVGRRTSGTIGDADSVDNNFYVIGNFCFDKARDGDGIGGMLSVEITGPAPIANAQLVLYSDFCDDNWCSWDEIFNADTGHFEEGLTCEDRIRTGAPGVGGGPAAQRQNLEVNVRGNQPIAQNFVRYWYVAVACCDCAPGALDSLTYEVVMLNDQTGWRESAFEFGADEKDLDILFVVYTVLYIIYFGAHFYALKELHALNGTIHAFITLFTGVVILQFVATLLQLVHWQSYGSNGVGVVGLWDVGIVLEVLARIFFLAILLLLAEGWTISTISLTSFSKKVIVGSLTTTTVVYIALLAWGFAERSPVMIRPPQAQQIMLYILTFIWVLYSGWFVFTCFKSFSTLNPGDEAQRPKRNLFLFLGFVYGLWLLALPVVEYTMTTLRDWERLRVVTITNTTITAFGFFVFTAVIWPSHASKYFNAPTRNAATISEDDYRRL